MLLWHPSKAKRCAEALGVTFGTHTLRLFESQILFTSLFKRKIRWAWHSIGFMSPPDCTHLAMSESEGFLGGEWDSWKHQAHKASARKKNIALKLGLSSTGIPTSEAAQGKQKAELIPFWTRHTFFFNTLPTASSPLLGKLEHHHVLS